MLGELDVMVQKYIRALSNRGAVISRTGAIAAATALLKKYPKIVGKIDLESSSWAKSLFMRMGYVRRKNTSSKVEIPDKARKEIEYQFHFDIVSKVEKYNIPDALIINLDQTRSYLVLCEKFTMAPKNSTNVAIHGCHHKRTMTAMFVITLAGEFLPTQLIYGDKTLQSLPRYQFPNFFSLSVNEYYSNTNESLTNEIVIPYINEIRLSHSIPDQYALIIMDVFTGQKTLSLNLLKDNKILVTNIPANMAQFYQPLDLTVNGYGKNFTLRKFSSWYTDQISLQLAKVVPINEIDVKLRLSLKKSLHAVWIFTDFCNHMTTPESKKIIESGWLSSGGRDTIRLGLNKLPSIDPFDDITLMTDTASFTISLLSSAFGLSNEEKSVGCSREETPDHDDDEESDEHWEAWTFKIMVHLTFSMILTIKIKFKL